MPRMRPASYRAGVEWIALNDEPGDRDPETASDYISSLLLAELFGVEPERVGRDVVRYRTKHDPIERNR
jgi:hypothetical protein